LERPAEFHKHLHRRRRCRKRRLPSGQALVKPGPLGEFQPITARPSTAEGRAEVGHLEGDLIVGAFNRSAIVTVFDRASRYLSCGSRTCLKGTAPTPPWPP
jgi:IS30 family transposase